MAHLPGVSESSGRLRRLLRRSGVTLLRSLVSATVRLGSSGKSRSRHTDWSTRLGNKESHALNLLDVVESKNADEGVRVVALAFHDLVHNCSSIGSSEHRKLPHGPVAAIVISRHVAVFTEDLAVLVELNARDSSHSDHVVDLGSNVTLSEFAGVRHGLEPCVVSWVNNFFTVCVCNSRAESRCRSHSTRERGGLNSTGCYRSSKVRGAVCSKEAEAQDDINSNRGGEGNVSHHCVLEGFGLWD
mmetsp:Transcript_19860/g.31557  ORF Transcript_19860/g.31557 Transcript_19860/m.31557 type:complete len:244 (+) Transcript_19860:342-1073(+)